MLIGAHLRPDDALVEGADRMDAAGLTLSAIAIGERDNLAAREVVARAAAVRQELARREIFVAIRYGATARDAAEAERKVAPHLARWKALLERWRGHAELTLRIGGGPRTPRPDRTAFTFGAEYLRALRHSREVAPEVAAFAEKSAARLRELAADLRTIRREDGSIEIALLVPRDRIDDAKGVAQSLKEAPGSVPFLLSGPWPLEVFADES
ncbi:MAG: GvpL/GvpF family gas vesicle protein [Thermoanaerobaculia bacterium]